MDKKDFFKAVYRMREEQKASRTAIFEALKNGLNLSLESERIIDEELARVEKYFIDNGREIFWK